ncbi:YidC/Oxa1 family insertase periplasmic-domain containing protein [Pantoea ananatis]|uniref:YidC/Oxa1 family insertase periplasmic-domain containing protein n=1 Tax=Pantoea ananas TaxID=553 RepID=UPI0039B94D42
MAPGASASTEARLWVGPKLVSQIAKENVRGLDRVVDYSRFWRCSGSGSATCTACSATGAVPAVKPR